MTTRMRGRITPPQIVASVLCAVVSLVTAACSTAPGTEQPPPEPVVDQSWKVCGNTVPGPVKPPAGAVIVDPTDQGDLIEKTESNPAGTTFWLKPGTHTFADYEFAQVGPKTGNTYIGAPGAIVDGRGVNRYAFGGDASDVTIKYLTIHGFVAPMNEGVVNHDSANGWVVAHSTLQNNAGAALMAGAHQIVRGNCLRNNGQYAMNAAQRGNGIVDLLVVGNEIVGNNTDNWEEKLPGCGCTGGIKFWAVNGAIIRENWIHDNHGAGLWADTNNNNFLIEDNLIVDNDAEAIIYEISYNAVIRNNIIIGNAMVVGRKFAKRRDNFPVAAIYISESGGEPRVPARTDKIEIYGNVLKNNWSGITLWENADRFCNSPANTSTGACTLLVDEVSQCSQPGISSEPLYSDCRWKTQRVNIHDNRFVHDPAVVGCHPEFGGRMAVLANYGTVPEWSPYKGEAIRNSITFSQGNRWHDNTYIGPWQFMPHDRSQSLDAEQWQSEPYSQDEGSTFTDSTAFGSC